MFYEGSRDEIPCGAWGGTPRFCFFGKDIGMSKSTQVFFYVLYSLLMAVAYGLVSFFVVYRLLANEVVLTAYIWNIVFIVGFIALDKLANDILLSDELVITKKNYYVAMVLHATSYVSFKTVLYLFYTFILIVSRISILEPNLMSADFRGFVLSIEYCLILVVAFDKFSEHLLKDDRRIKRITAKFAKFSNYMAERREKKLDKKKKVVF